MARYIRDAYTEQLMIPLLDGMLPVQILVELGIEKLQRDYIDSFCGPGKSYLQSTLDNCNTRGCPKFVPIMRTKMKT